VYILIGGISCLPPESTARWRVYIQNLEDICNLRRHRKQTGNGTGTMEFRLLLRLQSRFFLRYPFHSMPAIPPNPPHHIPNSRIRSSS